MDTFVNKVIEGDSTLIMKKMKENKIKVSSIITDPPYGVNFHNDFYDDTEKHVFSEAPTWLSLMFSLLEDDGHCFIFVPTLKIHHWILLAEKVGFVLKNIISARTYTSSVYHKKNFQFNSQHLLYLTKENPKRFNKTCYIKTSEAWFNDKRNKNPREYTYSYPSFMPPYVFANRKSTKGTTQHPNEKNIDFLKFLVEISTNKDDVVLDCFSGSGSLGVACKETGRNYICIEKDSYYVKHSRKRIKMHKLITKISKKDIL